MGKDIVVANSILEKYNLEFRYTICKMDEPATAELIVKDKNKPFQIGLIRFLQDKILTFYVGNISLSAETFEESRKIREKITILYEDVDLLNKLALPQNKEEL